MNTISEVLLAKFDMDGSQYSAMGVLPHPFYYPMGLQQPWVVMVVSRASTSTNRFTAGAPGLKFGRSKQNEHNLRGAPGQI